MGKTKSKSKKTVVKKTNTRPALKAVQKSPPDPTQLAVREAATTSAQMKAQVELLKVDSQESAIQASRMLVQLKTATEQLTEKRKFFTAPLKEHIKRIEALFRPTLDLLINADQQLRGKLLNYQHTERARKNEEQAKLLKDAEKAQAKGDGETALALATEATQLDVVQRTQHVEDGSVQSKRVWTFEVEDLGKVPPEYFSLDEAKVRTALRAGFRDIPGLRIFQKEQLAVSRLASVEENGATFGDGGF